MRTCFLLLMLAILPPATADGPIVELVAAPPGLSVVEPIEAAEIPMETALTPVTFLTADAAEIIEKPGTDGVAIFAEGLKAGAQYGMLLTVSNQPVDWIEVHPATFFPVKVLRPIRPNAFLIEGKVGEVFYVSIRAGSVPPVWMTVTIVTDNPVPTDPPVDPPTDGAIEQLSRARANAVNDPPTRAVLKVDLNTAIAAAEARCAAGDCPPLPEAADALVAAIEASLEKRRGESEYIEWKAGWRTPISDAVKAKATTTQSYLALMKEAARGL